jgi:hypothetical protein
MPSKLFGCFHATIFQNIEIIIDRLGLQFVTKVRVIE